MAPRFLVIFCRMEKHLLPNQSNLKPTTPDVNVFFSLTSLVPVASSPPMSWIFLIDSASWPVLSQMRSLAKLKGAACKADSISSGSHSQSLQSSPVMQTFASNLSMSTILILWKKARKLGATIPAFSQQMRANIR